MWPTNSTSPNLSFHNDDDISYRDPQLWALVLIPMPIICIVGNGLVVIAVLSERSLQTTTNYLLVSLAAADLLIGTLVMPFALYLTVNNLQWNLPIEVCNFFCVVDVAGSTASIIHLVAISMDRFFAVYRHVEYKTRKHQKRVYCSLVFAWIFSLCISLPLGIGLNRSTQYEEHRCGISHEVYMLSSSIFSFYIPCIIMGVMYSFVFYRLNQRLRVVKLQEMAAGQMVNFGDNIGNILSNVYGENSTKGGAMNWAMPFLKTIETTIIEDEEISSEEIDELTTILHTLESDRRIKRIPHHRRESQESTMHAESSENRNRHLIRFPDGLRRKSIMRAKNKMLGLKERAVEILMKLKSKQGLAIRKETRATKLVVTVMITFLICWLPFFTLNVVKVTKLWNNTWNDDLEIVFISFTWLGFVNSTINPIIYTSINRKFRATFRRLILCQGKVNRQKQWAMRSTNRRRMEKHSQQDSEKPEKLELIQPTTTDGKHTRFDMPAGQDNTSFETNDELQTIGASTTDSPRAIAMESNSGEGNRSETDKSEEMAQVHKSASATLNKHLASSSSSPFLPKSFSTSSFGSSSARQLNIFKQNNEEVGETDRLLADSDQYEPQFDEGTLEIIDLDEAVASYDNAEFLPESRRLLNGGPYGKTTTDVDYPHTFEIIREESYDCDLDTVFAKHEAGNRFKRRTIQGVHYSADKVRFFKPNGPLHEDVKKALSLDSRTKRDVHGELSLLKFEPELGDEML